MAAKAGKGLSFEERLEKLEAIVEKMEQETAPLETLLRDYEEGMKLSASLEAELQKARARMMEVRSGKGGAPEVNPSRVAVQGTLLEGLEEEE